MAHPAFFCIIGHYYQVHIAPPGGKMKQLAIFISMLFVGTLSFAGSSSSLNTLGSAFKATQTSKLQPGHDINIVYGGEDVSQKVSLLPVTETA